MCVNYITVNRQTCFDWFRRPLEVTTNGVTKSTATTTHSSSLMDEQGRRAFKVGGYGCVPQRHWPFKRVRPEEQAKIDLAITAGKIPKPERIAIDTMNARAEEVGGKGNYKRFWLSQQLCIVSAQYLFEPLCAQHRRSSVRRKAD